MCESDRPCTLDSSVAQASLSISGLTFSLLLTVLENAMLSCFAV